MFEPRTFQLVASRSINCLVLAVKGKGIRNRPGVAQKVPGVIGFQISWHSTRKGGEVVSLTHCPPLPQEMFLVLIFTGG
jgi:hypothetical protein